MTDLELKLIYRRGFTVVELLIVIAIIGILASVIIASLNDARSSGIEAKIKSELVLLGKRAKIVESQTLTYDTVCGTSGFATSSEIRFILDAIEQFSSEPVVCNSSSEAFAVSAATGSSTYWCVDSEGNSRDIPSHLTTTPVELICP